MNRARPLLQPDFACGGGPDVPRSVEPARLFQGLVFVWQAAMAAARGVPLGRPAFDAGPPLLPSQDLHPFQTTARGRLEIEARPIPGPDAAFARAWDTAFWPSLLRGPG